MTGKTDSKQSSSAARNKRTHTYLEMVQIALITLSEKGGSTRQEIWKCISAKFPVQSDYKRFIVALKKMVNATENAAIIYGKNKQRFKLEPKFRIRLMSRLEKGLPMEKAIKSAATMDRIKKAVKKPKKSKAKKQNKKAKSKKGAKSAAAAKAKKGAKGANKKQSTKDKIKEKAKANKKTEGSKKAQKATADKKSK